jgi:hypothetical protein
MANSTITNNALHPGGVASDIYRELPKPIYEVMKIGLVPTSVPAKLITDMAIADHWAIVMVNMSVHICQTGNHHMLKTSNLPVIFILNLWIL